MAPAIGYARDGFPVAELMADEWQVNQDARRRSAHRRDVPAATASR